MTQTQVIQVALGRASRDYFVGEVMSRALLEQTEGRPAIAMVHFADGAHTRPHTHTGEQLIFIIRGKLEITTSADTVWAKTGELIVCPADVEHTHSAAGDEDCETLAITWGTTKWPNSQG